MIPTEKFIYISLNRTAEKHNTNTVGPHIFCFKKINNIVPTEQLKCTPRTEYLDQLAPKEHYITELQKSNGTTELQQKSEETYRSIRVNGRHGAITVGGTQKDWNTNLQSCVWNTFFLLRYR